MTFFSLSLDFRVYFKKSIFIFFFAHIDMNFSHICFSPDGWKKRAKKFSSNFSRILTLSFFLKSSFCGWRFFFSLNRLARQTACFTSKAKTLYELKSEEKIVWSSPNFFFRMRLVCIIKKFGCMVR